MTNVGPYPNPVRILLISDVADDLERALRDLLETGFAYSSRVAYTLEDFCCGLEWQPDLILCADVLRDFDAYRAVEALALRALDIPLIVVAAACTHDKVKAWINKGAGDVMATDAVHQLAISIKNALRIRLLQIEKRGLQDALNQSEARFRDVAELSSDWYWEQDEHFRFKLFSRDVADSGCEGAAIIGQTRWDHPGVDTRSADFEAHQAMCRAHHPFRDFIYRRTGQDGIEHWISASGQPVFDHAGDFKGYRGLGRDVTARRHTERRVEQAKSFLDAVVNAIPTPVLVKDDQHRYIAANAAFTSFFRRGLSDILGKTDYDFFPPEDAAFYQATDHDALATGRVVEYERAYTLDGISRWMLVRKCRLIRPDETPVIVLMLSDVTQRRAAEQALRQSEARFRSLTELSADWYWEQDDEFRFTFVSDDATKRSGFPGPRSLGLTRWDHPGIHLDSADWAAHQAACQAHQPFREFSYRRTGVDGSLRWVSVSGEPFFDEQGRFKGYRGIGSDITARKRVEQQITRTKDLYAALSKTNQAIIQIREPNALCQEVCRIAVEYGHFCLVWIGLLDQDTGWVEPLAVEGPASQGYPRIRVSVDPTVPEGQGFSGAALREGKHYVVNDFFAHARIAPWAKQAQAAGVKSLATFPLRKHAHCVGVLNLHGDEVDFFTPELVALLTEMADNVSFALNNMQREAERERAQQDLAESEQKFRQLAANIPEVFWMAAPRYERVSYVSPAYERVWGRSAERLLAFPNDWLDAVHPEDHDRVVAKIRAASDGLFDHEYRIVRPDGSVRWIHDRAFPILNEQGELALVTGIAEDITEHKAAEEQLMLLAHYDHLTGLPNRALFYDRLKQSLAHAQRCGRAAAVLFVDLDHFKMVNDTLGHAAGDQLLQRVAHQLKQTLRAGDTVGRLGGDEFAIILTDLACNDDAGVAARKLMLALEQPFDLDGRELFVSASAGIALYPVDGTDADTLIQHADTAMYRAKESGRSSWQFYKSEMNARSLERISLEGHLRRALERNEFVLHYQPKVGVATGKITGVEALLRWHHPELGLVPPGQFIHILEDNGLIVQVGEWVLREVCRQLKLWSEEGLVTVPVALNLSGRQLQHNDVERSIKQILSDAAIDPRLIELEITESVLMRNPEHVARVLRQLKELGIRLSVDDFGTGYSSLAYLKSFPLDTLKIDRSFVKDLTSCSDDAAIVQAIVALARSLGLTTVAEGVENNVQLALLTAFGCNEYQGYYFSRPVVPGNIASLLKEEILAAA